MPLVSLGYREIKTGFWARTDIMVSMSPTSLTLRALRKSNYAAGVVERWVPEANIRRDLFNCIDIIAARRGDPGIIGIQATSISNLPTRLSKARSQPELAVWLAAGGRFECWGWYFREGRWKVKRVEVKAGDVAPLLVGGPRRRRKRVNQPGLFDALQAG